MCAEYVIHMNRNFIFSSKVLEELATYFNIIMVNYFIRTIFSFKLCLPLMVKKVIFIFMQRVSISLTSLTVTNGNSSCRVLIGEGYLNPSSRSRRTWI